MEYNARKAFLDVKKSGINSKRDKDRYILLQEILKERFPDYPMELLSYTDKGTGWEVRVRLVKVHPVPVLSDGFNILISDRDVLIHLIQKP